MFIIILAWLSCVVSFGNAWLWLQGRKYEKKKNAYRDANMLCFVLAFLLCVALVCVHFIFEQNEKDFDTKWNEEWTKMHSLMQRKLIDFFHNSSEPTPQTGFRRPMHIENEYLSTPMPN